MQGTLQSHNNSEEGSERREPDAGLVVKGRSTATQRMEPIL